MKNPVLLTYYLRIPGRQSVRILCYDADTLAQGICTALRLSPAQEVRIDVDPHTFMPAGTGRITTPAQRVLIEFQTALAGATTLPGRAA